MFNGVKTYGGEKLLDEIFHAPLTNAQKINARSKIFHFFQKGGYTFPIDNAEFITAEQYLSQTTYSNAAASWFNALRIHALARIGIDREYQLVREGLAATVQILKALKTFVKKMEQDTRQNMYAENCEIVKNILADKQLSWIESVQLHQDIKGLKCARYDHAIRYRLKNEMKTLLDILYDIDVNIAVAAVANEKSLHYAVANEQPQNTLYIEDVFHPGLKNAVSNTLYFDEKKNVIFLTGANMAGKSTLMKAMGVATYLAHMGFPVPAKKMEFSVKDGMFTSINVPDNLTMGYSHFYAEVLRVKAIAKEVASNRRLFIIFDELFKGTNVKDAYEATVAITEAFSKNTNSSFIISTHIMEAGETLRKEENNIQFVYLPTEIENNAPVYSYKLREGITDDRHGMIIIRNEKIIEIINGE